MDIHSKNSYFKTCSTTFLQDAMDLFLEHFMAGLPLSLLFCAIALFILLLGKGADILVDEAVTLSLRSGVPKVMIGATIVSLGTTLPEASVSVFAALKGSPGLALGNAIGSIICDTGLILGLAAVIRPLPLSRNLVNRQGWIQLGSGILLILALLPYDSLSGVFIYGGRLPQAAGFLFLVLLVFYLWLSLRWAKKTRQSVSLEDEGIEVDTSGTAFIVAKLIGGIFIVVISSRILIPAVQETAFRLNIPESIIAATLVAFGTSLPELVTAMTAVRKGHGELAVGNVVGADILNVLFVSGAAASVTPGGLQAPAHFFKILLPGMLLILVTFRIGIMKSGNRMKRPFGFVLLGIYILITVLSYLK